MARNRRALSSRWGVLLLLVLVGSSLARTAHWLAVPHRLCEVHGTLEHGLAADGVASARAGADGPSYRQRVKEHDECTFGPLGRTEVAPLPAAPHLSGVELPSRPEVFVPPEPAPSVPLLFLAPKRSPPA